VIGVEWQERTGSAKILEETDVSWTKDQVSLITHIISSQMKNIESQLIEAATAAEAWEVIETREEPGGFERRGHAWTRQGNKNQSEIVIFGESGSSRGPASANPSDSFDQFAMMLNSLHPAIDGTVYYSMEGIVRRLPGNGFSDRLLQKSKPERINLSQLAAKTNPNHTAWFEGAEFCTHPLQTPFTILAPIYIKKQLKGAIACEVDLAEYVKTLPLPRQSWAFLMDANGGILASDSTAITILGVPGTHLLEHPESSLSHFGSKLMRRVRGSGTQTIGHSDYVFAYEMIPDHPWRIVLGFSVESGRTTWNLVRFRSVLILTGGAVLIFLLCLAVYRYLLNRSEGIIDKVAIFFQNLRESIRSISANTPLTQIETSDFEELVALSYAIRETRLQLTDFKNELSRENNLLEAVIEAFKIGIVILDRRFIVLHANMAAKNIHPDLEVGKPASWLSKETEYMGGALASEAMTKKILQTTEYEAVVNSEILTFKVTYFPVFNAQGIIDGLGESTFEISELQALRQQLEQIRQAEAEGKPKESQKSTPVSFQITNLHELMESITRDFRSQLNALTKTTEQLAQNDFSNPTEVKENCRLVMRDARRVLLHLLEVKDMIGYEARSLIPELKPFSILAITGAINEYMRSLIDTSTIQFNIDNREGAFAMHSDQRRVRQILLILLEHIVQFTMSNRIKITIKLELPYVIFEVSANGKIKTDMEVLKQIFQPDYLLSQEELDPIFTRLLISHLTVRALSGKIEFHSLDLKGFMFVVALPKDLEATKFSRARNRRR